MRYTLNVYERIFTPNSNPSFKYSILKGICKLSWMILLEYVKVNEKGGGLNCTTTEMPKVTECKIGKGRKGSSQFPNLEILGFEIDFRNNNLITLTRSFKLIDYN